MNFARHTARSTQDRSARPIKGGCQSGPLPDFRKAGGLPCSPHEDQENIS